jgi:hypothetical protein
MTSIYYHEDDYCQIEILPVENLSFCLEQAGLIDEFAEAHKDKDGFGYTDAFVRSENPVQLHNNKIPYEAFEKAIIKIFPKYDEVTTGYSPYQEKNIITSAFGCDENVVVFCEEEDGVVKNIWLTLDVFTENDMELAGELFVVLSTLGDFIIADWGWSFIAEINDREKIEQYIQKRFDIFK